MQAAIPMLVSVTAATATYGAVESNQQAQHAKGAAQAESTAAQGAIDAQKATDQKTSDQKQTNASATQSAAIQALRASLSASSGFGGSILTSGQGTQTTAPTATKSLLGA